MKVIIAGSRTINNYGMMEHQLERVKELINITEVVSGTASGVDSLGEIWAQINSIAVTRFSADWRNKGKRAGFLRNEEMAQYADAAIIFWDGESKGTIHMLDLSLKYGLQTFLYTIKE